LEQTDLFSTHPGLHTAVREEGFKLLDKLPVACHLLRV